jgi:hypothetical protein
MRTYVWSPTVIVRTESVAELLGCLVNMCCWVSFGQPAVGEMTFQRECLALKGGNIRRLVLKPKTVEAKFIRLKNVVVRWADEIVAVGLVPVDSPLRKRVAVGPLVMHVQIAFEPAFPLHGTVRPGSGDVPDTNGQRRGNRCGTLEKITSGNVLRHGSVILDSGGRQLRGMRVGR